MREGKNLKHLGSQSTQYGYKEPDIKTLETFENKYPMTDYKIKFIFHEMTSLCPKTGQPDFGTIKITYIANQKCIETKSLKLYLFEYRQHGAFMETTINKILDDLVAVCLPRQMKVTGNFNPRGGIFINVQAKYKQQI